MSYMCVTSMLFSHSDLQAATKQFPNSGILTTLMQGCIWGCQPIFIPQCQYLYSVRCFRHPRIETQGVLLHRNIGLGSGCLLKGQKSALRDVVVE